MAGIEVKSVEHLLGTPVAYAYAMKAKVLRAQYFCADIAAFPGIAMTWSARYGKQPHPFVCVQTPTPMPAPGMAVIADLWIAV